MKVPQPVLFVLFTRDIRNGNGAMRPRREAARNACGSCSDMFSKICPLSSANTALRVHTEFTRNQQGLETPLIEEHGVARNSGAPPQINGHRDQDISRNRQFIQQQGVTPAKKRKQKRGQHERAGCFFTETGDYAGLFPRKGEKRISVRRHSVRLRTGDTRRRRQRRSFSSAPDARCGTGIPTH